MDQPALFAGNGSTLKRVKWLMICNNWVPESKGKGHFFGSLKAPKEWIKQPQTKRFGLSKQVGGKERRYVRINWKDNVEEER